MKNIYARFVLWLIAPALEHRDVLEKERAQDEERARLKLQIVANQRSIDGLIDAERAARVSVDEAEAKARRDLEGLRGEGRGGSF